jgi:hypothetical protein
MSAARARVFIAMSAALAAAVASSSAQAEFAAVRAPELGASIAFVEGAPESSRALWIKPWLAITQETRMPFDALGLGIGLRHTLVGRERGWALGLQMGAGFIVPTLRPGVALAFAPSTNVRFRSEGVWFSMGLAAPSTVRFDAPLDLRVPAQGELWLAFRAGPLWIGATAAMGVAFSPGANAGLLVQGAGLIAVPFGDDAAR